MKLKKSIYLLFFFILFFMNTLFSQNEKQNDARMNWWREARFGMFIHWGLYAIPAGEWKDKKNYGEWIRTSAEIPLEVYDKFVERFNPIKFEPEKWVQMAKDAGMKYIVITTKHHDGFCLFDSKYTDFDVMSTPFKRDIMKELAMACKKEGIKMCWYHSIMDWHHPDYLPRRDWEKTRSIEGANFDTYVKYMKNQLKELLTNYGEIGVLWFDGEWETTWNTKYGIDLYKYVRGLQPGILVNNRVGAGRSGMEGFTKEGEFGGDFGTPEQEIPATGLPGVDWETCMTMNDHWGYNKYDKRFKSIKELIRNLADIASKGGNFLLNVGPTAEGLIPDESIDRLKEMGNWMKTNSESIYGTVASPFKNLEFGRCTQKSTPDGTRLYLHVFDWPKDGELVIPGIFNKVKESFLLSDLKKVNLSSIQKEGEIIIKIPADAPDKNNNVIVLDVLGKPEIYHPAKFGTDINIFIDEMKVPVFSENENIEIRYTLDGSLPDAAAPEAKGMILLKNSALITTKIFRNGKALSEPSRMRFKKVVPKPSEEISELKRGLTYSYFEGEWNKIPDFSTLKPLKEGVVKNFDISPRKEEERFGFEYKGYIKIPKDAVYEFFTSSDDGSSLYIDGEHVVNNDDLHGLTEKRGLIALKAGLHRLKVNFFDNTGSNELNVYYKYGDQKKSRISDEMLFYK